MGTENAARSALLRARQLFDAYVWRSPTGRLELFRYQRVLETLKDEFPASCPIFLLWRARGRYQATPLAPNRLLRRRVTPSGTACDEGVAAWRNAGGRCHACNNGVHCWILAQETPWRYENRDVAPARSGHGESGIRRPGDGPADAQYRYFPDGDEDWKTLVSATSETSRPDVGELRWSRRNNRKERATKRKSGNRGRVDNEAREVQPTDEDSGPGVGPVDSQR